MKMNKENSKRVMVNDGRPFIWNTQNPTKKRWRIYGTFSNCCVCGHKFFHPGKAGVGAGVCSPACSGKKFAGNKSPRWKGGKHIPPNGYVHVLLPVGHPWRRGRRYIVEHRMVVQNKIGRELASHEFVHHLNGNKTDNRIENLALCSRQNHFDFIKRLQDRICELEQLLPTTRPA